MSWGDVDNWQVSRLVRNISRNTRITNPDGAALAAVRVFLKVLCDPTIPGVGTRPWIIDTLKSKGVVAGYEGDIDTAPPHIIVKMLDHVSRDFRKIGMTAAEKAAFDTMVSEFPEQKFGVGPTFGGVAGSE